MRNVFAGYLFGMTQIQPRFARKTLCGVIPIFVFTLKAICAEPTFTAESNGLRLEVSCEIIELTPPPSLEKIEPKPEPFFQVEITSLLKNVSDHEMVVPTSAYDGRSCWGGDGESTFYGCYEIGFRRIKNQQLQASPYRYFPVTLKPGESVELSQFMESKHMKQKPNISWIRVVYSVDPEYAARLGWWSGALHYGFLDDAKSNKAPKNK